MATLSPIRMTRVVINTANEGTFDRMIIYATSTNGSHGFGRINNSVVELSEEVPMGQYNFYGLAYNAMSIKKCSKASAYLGGATNQVTLTFNDYTCADTEFLGNDSSFNGLAYPAVSFPYTSIELCNAVSNITDVNDVCSDNLNITRKHKRGHAMSAKISLVAYDKVRGVYTTGTDYGWGCQPVTPLGGGLDGLAISGVSNFAPAGDGASTPFLMRFEFYPNSGCTGTPHVVDLPNGIIADNAQVKYVQDAPSRKLYFKIGQPEICKGTNLVTEFAGGDGSIGSPKLICNESQFYSIFPATNVAADYLARANFNYKLMNDIDLSDNPVTGSGFNPPWSSCVDAGSNFMPIGYTWNGSSCGTTFSGGIHFEGNGRTIKGMKIKRSGSFVGMYRRIDHAGGQASNFQNLIITNSIFEGSQYVGALSAQSQRTTFRNINLIDVSVRSTVGAHTGTVAGETFGAVLTRVHGTGITVNGFGLVGGLIGQTTIADDGSTTSITDSSVRGTITGVSHIGGLVGKLGNLSEGIKSTIDKSSYVGLINGDNHIGGLVGEAITLRIENSYTRVGYDTTAAGDVRLGGMVGSMNEYEATPPASGIYSSYIKGTISYDCSPVNTTCHMGTVVGWQDGTFTGSDFNTVVYNSSSHLSSTTPFVYGVPQTNASFMSAAPGWFRPGPIDMMIHFNPAIWKFSDAFNPSLVGEPNP